MWRRAYAYRSGLTNTLFLLSNLIKQMSSHPKGIGYTWQRRCCEHSILHQGQGIPPRSWSQWESCDSKIHREDQRVRCPVRSWRSRSRWGHSHQPYYSTWYNHWWSNREYEGACQASIWLSCRAEAHWTLCRWTEGQGIGLCVWRRYDEWTDHTWVW